MKTKRKLEIPVMYRLVEEVHGESLTPDKWKNSNFIEFKCTRAVNCKVYISIRLLLEDGSVYQPDMPPLPLVYFDLDMVPGVIRAYEWKMKLIEFYTEEEKYEFCYLAKANSIIPYIEIRYEEVSNNG